MDTPTCLPMIAPPRSAWPSRRWRTGLSVLCLLGLLGGCATPWPEPTARSSSLSDPLFKPVQRQPGAPLATKEELALLEESTDPVYRIGAGDVLRVDVYGRAEVSGRHVVGPDGRITLPLLGDVRLGEQSREEAADTLRQTLRTLYTAPVLSLGVEEYTSNQVTVLGRVERAGAQRFSHPPTLAEVLANAGAMPILDKQATLTRGAIMRGRDKLIWVDLKALLNGDLAYNLRMRKGDIVFIPDSSETAVYVLGAVAKPGSYRLTPRMTVLDALAQAGGTSENARPHQIGVYRAGARKVEVIEFAALIGTQRTVNYALEDGDVVFVPNSTLAEIGYVLRQIGPAVSVLSFGVSVSNLSGASK
ncbi:SLBB domain-containing protein [Mitsuaria sp. WAJ17]|uniref:SLBB domain-containing protein n=1 Tax=Mitsuaria sp. WAJ17 TaxID=2761452 RepID=UPI001602043D|nr:polysaccharide biosynthesis/export family protein [Mitsuaria sp. WAJ17]MBB2487067.1 SLBB domain-containing protein [Mitsuaria sp. WAJ17]